MSAHYLTALLIRQTLAKTYNSNIRPLSDSITHQIIPGKELQQKCLHYSLDEPLQRTTTAMSALSPTALLIRQTLVKNYNSNVRPFSETITHQKDPGKRTTSEAAWQLCSRNCVNNLLAQWDHPNLPSLISTAKAEVEISLVSQGYTPYMKEIHNSIDWLSSILIVVNTLILNYYVSSVYSQYMYRMYRPNVIYLWNKCTIWWVEQYQYISMIRQLIRHSHNSFGYCNASTLGHYVNYCGSSSLHMISLDVL